MGPKQFRKSNLVMVGILGLSIVAAASMELLVRSIDGKRESDDDDDSHHVLDGAARRERREQRGLWKWRGKRDEV